MQGLRFPKVNVEHAGSPSHNLFPRYVSLLREEHIFLFYLGHNIGMSLNLFMMDVFRLRSKEIAPHRPSHHNPNPPT
jgi:hypothetical protein